MESEVAPDSIPLKYSPESLKSVFLRVSFCAEMAEHDDLRPCGALFANMVKEPCRLLVFHVESAIVVRVLLQELGIVVGFHKDEVRVDTVFNESFPIMEVRHNDDFTPETALTTMNDETKIVAVGLMGDGQRTENEFPDAERPL